MHKYIYAKHKNISFEYNAVSLIDKPHNRHTINRPLGQDMGYLLWVQILICAKAGVPTKLYKYVMYNV